MCMGGGGGQEAKSWFLAAGYAVVSIDVRGTGASFGRWRAPWTPEERADSREVVDWISHQPWSNGQARAHHRGIPFLWTKKGALYPNVSETFQMCRMPVPCGL